MTVAPPAAGLDSSGEGEAVGACADGVAGAATDGDAAVLVQAASATAATMGRNNRKRMVNLLWQSGGESRGDTHRYARISAPVFSCALGR
jgi:hypothetical protein